MCPAGRSALDGGCSRVSVGGADGNVPSGLIEDKSNRELRELR